MYHLRYTNALYPGYCIVSDTLSKHAVSIVKSRILFMERAPNHCRGGSGTRSINDRQTRPAIDDEPLAEQPPSRKAILGRPPSIASTTRWSPSTENGAVTANATPARPVERPVDRRSPWLYVPDMFSRAKGEPRWGVLIAGTGTHRLAAIGVSAAMARLGHCSPDPTPTSWLAPSGRKPLPSTGAAASSREPAPAPRRDRHPIRPDHRRGPWANDTGRA